MKLLRFNKEPLEINPNEIASIEAHDGLLSVCVNNNIYLGYYLK